MSEANIPDKDQMPELTDSAYANLESSADLPGVSDSGGDRSVSSGETSPTPQTEDWQDWQTVDFPNAISADAIERQALYAEDVAPFNWATRTIPPSATSPAWENVIPSQPNIADLISLVQELNQCNNALLDRVSQLEEALERSHTAQVEGRSPDPQLTTQDPQELIAAQEQVTYLSNQLEFANQASQRQQILIETLTEQLESSQERVAQLERECTLTQQRSSEQSQLVAQSENTCRDLRARLQRQQRYTLQFKVALEKCLEVPPPSYESTPDSPATVAQPRHEAQSSLIAQPFLPKVQRIQPWSSQSTAKGELNLELPPDQTLDSFLPKAELAEESSHTPHSGAIAEALSLTPPVLISPHPQAVLVSGSPTSSVTAAQSPLSYDLKKIQADGQAAIEPPDATIQIPASPSEATQADISEMHLSWDSPTAQPGGSGDEAEVALWQDLARLIDVSTDDVVKANQSGDFTDFEATDPNVVKVDNSGAPDPAGQNAPPVQQITSEQILNLLVQSGLELQHPSVEEVAQENGLTQGLPDGVASNYPSPVVYPLRSPKKIKSLAAIDLPNFPR